MDASTVGVAASVLIAFGGGTTAIIKVLVDRHLSALTRLEERAERTAQVQERTALAFDVAIMHLQDLRSGQDRIERDVQRVVDHLGLPSHGDTVPAAPPEPIPRSSVIIGARPPAPSKPT